MSCCCRCKSGERTISQTRIVETKEMTTYNLKSSVDESSRNSVRTDRLIDSLFPKSFFTEHSVQGFLDHRLTRRTTRIPILIDFVEQISQSSVPDRFEYERTFFLEDFEEECRGEEGSQSVVERVECGVVEN